MQNQSVFFLKGFPRNAVIFFSIGLGKVSGNSLSEMVLRLEILEGDSAVANITLQC
ncbi:hypothetical protein [Euhalothece natronophila]|uniref:hypothetical protein n=1 Tax=Euhalothece natronophila TaxID=577489 RepID=UPI00164839EC|nr:hypothetical protein [Euhalothece natronophila]